MNNQAHLAPALYMDDYYQSEDPIMSSVSFSGLASGIDTASIVESIIESERTPITTMESTQTYLQTKLDT